MKRAIAWFWSKKIAFIGVLLVIAVFAWNAFDAIENRAVSIEEGEDLIAARAVMRGGVPLRDFAYTPSVLFPYLAGPILSATQYGAFELRCFDTALAALGLIAVCIAFARRSGRAEVGIVAGFSVAASPHWVNAVVAGGPIAAATLGLGVATSVALSRRALLPRAVLFTAASCLAFFCEPITAFALLALSVCLLFEVRRGIHRALLLIAIAAVPCAWVVALSCVSQPGALADLWRVHFAAETAQPWRLSLAKSFAVSPGAFLVALASLSAMPKLLEERSFAPIVCLAAAALGVAAAFPPTAESCLTSAISFPLLAGAGLTAAWALAKGEGSPLRHVLWVVPVMSFYVPVSESAPNLPQEEISTVAEFLETHVPAGQILTPFPAIAVASRRQVLRGTELGANGVLAPGHEREAQQLHLTTPGVLARKVEELRPSAVILHRDDQLIDFGLERRSRAPMASGEVQRFQRAVAERYERAFTTESLALYVPRKPKKGDLPKSGEDDVER